MKIYKPKFWSKKRSLTSFLLLPISSFLQLLVLLKNIFNNTEKFSVPIICIGNIYLGGTGKTPLSIKIVKILEKINKRTAIVKKFYSEHIDEFKLIESKKIILFKNLSRTLAIKEAITSKFECIVLDDGFQDMSINKNLNIICFNEKQLIGNGMTIPSGPLRESMSSLKKCQIVMINGDKNIEFERQVKNISENINIFYSKYLPVDIEKFKDHKLLVFAGIGNPENFFNLLEKNNLKIFKKMSFPDHYNYSLSELNKIINFASKNNLKILTSEKDYFRIKHYKLSEIHHLNINLEIENEETFIKEITRYI